MRLNNPKLYVNHSLVADDDDDDDLVYVFAVILLLENFRFGQVESIIDETSIHLSRSARRSLDVALLSQSRANVNL